MLDTVMWWTGLVVWIVVGGAAIAVTLAWAALWAAAYVANSRKIVGDFVRFVRAERDEHPAN